MASPTPQIKAVLFDMDGLLIDSERVYTRITNELLQPYGKSMTWELKSKVMGRPGLDAAAVLIAETGLTMKPEEVVLAMAKRQEELFPHVPAMPGAIKVVQHLAKHNIPIAVATGSTIRNFSLKSSNPNTSTTLFAPFGNRIVCGDDPLMKRGKPAPDVFLIAASRHAGLKCSPDPTTGFFNPPPLDDSNIRADQILVFEDGVPGVVAAHAAGMKSIWVAEPELLTSLGHEAIANIPATLQISSLEEWKPEEWGLPPY